MGPPSGAERTAEETSTAEGEPDRRQRRRRSPDQPATASEAAAMRSQRLPPPRGGAEAEATAPHGPARSAAADDGIAGLG